MSAAIVGVGIRDRTGVVDVESCPVWVDGACGCGEDKRHQWSVYPPVPAGDKRTPEEWAASCALEALRLVCHAQTAVGPWGVTIPGFAGKTLAELEQRAKGEGQRAEGKGQKAGSRERRA